MARDPEALVGVEVALHRNVVFVDGRVAAGRETAAVEEADIVALVRQAFADAGYGVAPSGVFRPEPKDLEVRTDLCLGPLPEDERAIRDVSDDQSICVGHAAWGPRAGHRPLEQALASDFVAALERLRVDRPGLGLGPDGKTLVTVRGRALVGVSLSIQHARDVDWVALTRAARAACEAVAGEHVAEGELEPLGSQVDWLRERGGGLRGGRARGRQRPLGREADGSRGIRRRSADSSSPGPMKLLGMTMPSLGMTGQRAVDHAGASRSMRARQFPTHGHSTGWARSTVATSTWGSAVASAMRSPLRSKMPVR